MSWTASFHPLAFDAPTFEANIHRLAELRHRGPFKIGVTMTVAAPTLPILEASIRFVRGLPVDHYQFHLDAHQPIDAVAAQALVEQLAPGAFVTAGPPRKGVICDRTKQLLALGADGTLYECVTKAYQNLDPIGNIADTTIDLASLPIRRQFCGLDCFACCDRVKHIYDLGGKPS